MGIQRTHRPRLILLASAALIALAACDEDGNIRKQDFDWDIRNIGGGGAFDTSDAARNVANRPRPDDRGVISYPNYQVVVADRGETVRQIAGRLNLDANTLAAFNGVDADVPLRRDEIVALPARVAEPSPATGAVTTGPIQPPAEVNVTTLASDAIDRAGQQTVAHPGQGSQTPTPPSAVVPLPDVDVTPEAPEVTPPAPDIGEVTTPAPATSAPFIFPVRGSIIREYNPGRNEGIDIGASAGTSVQAAANGTIAAITQNTNGAQIIVVRHTGNILTVYVNVDDLSVEKGDSVTQGQSIAKVAEGSPSFLHFEVRDGLESVDPADYLP